MSQIKYEKIEDGVVVGTCLDDSSKKDVYKKEGWTPKDLEKARAEEKARIDAIAEAEAKVKAEEKARIRAEVLAEIEAEKAPKK